MTSQEISDLFRWMVATDRIDLRYRLDSEDVDQICSLIEGRAERWRDEWRDYQRSLPSLGIGLNPTFQG